MTDVVVIGSGIAGLAAAAEVARTGMSVTVLDAHGVGGRARTTTVDGYELNVGPHAIYLGGTLFRLLTELGINVPGQSPPTDAGWLLVRDTLHRLPGGPKSLLTTTALSARSKLRTARILAGLPKLDTATLVGTSVSTWLADLPADLRLVFDGLVRVSSYTDLPDEFDAGAAAAQIQLALKPGVRYVDHGWQTIIDGLRRYVTAHGGEVREHAQVTEITESVDSAEVRLADGTVIAAAHVVVAAGGPQTVTRLAGRPVEGADRLGPPVEAACLDLGLRRVSDRSFILGGDQPLYLSLHAPTAALAPPGGAVLSMMRYLRPGAEPPDHAVTRTELRVLATRAGVTPADIVSERYLARMTVTHGVPTARGGGLAGRPTVDALGLSRLSIAGDWVGGEGLLADASAASGRAAARRAVTLTRSIRA